jgi:hypothetical protein
MRRVQDALDGRGFFTDWRVERSLWDFLRADEKDDDAERGQP